MHNLDLNDSIKHYGIPGMKWGRRKRGSGGSAKRRLRIFRRRNVETETSGKKDRSINDLEREIQFRKEYQNRDKMSTKQIQARIARIRAEQEFEKLTGDPARQRAAAEARKAKERKARAVKIVAAIANAAGSIPVETLNVGVDPKQYKDKESYDKAVKKQRDKIKEMQKPIAAAGKILNEYSKIQQGVIIPGKTGTSDLYLSNKLS